MDKPTNKRLKKQPASKAGAAPPVVPERTRSKSVGDLLPSDHLLTQLMNGTLPTDAPKKAGKHKSAKTMPSTHSVPLRDKKAQQGKEGGAKEKQPARKEDKQSSSAAFDLASTQLQTLQKKGTQSNPDMKGSKTKKAAVSKGREKEDGFFDRAASGVPQTPSRKSSELKRSMSDHPVKVGQKTPLVTSLSFTTYAGPSFHNSPDAKSLPVPVFHGASTVSPLGVLPGRRSSLQTVTSLHSSAAPPLIGSPPSSLTSPGPNGRPTSAMTTLTLSAQKEDWSQKEERLQKEGWSQKEDRSQKEDWSQKSSDLMSLLSKPASVPSNAFAHQPMMPASSQQMMQAPQHMTLNPPQQMNAPQHMTLNPPPQMNAPQHMMPPPSQEMQAPQHMMLNPHRMPNGPIPYNPFMPPMMPMMTQYPPPAPFDLPVPSQPRAQPSQPRSQPAQPPFAAPSPQRGPPHPSHAAPHSLPHGATAQDIPANPQDRLVPVATTNLRESSFAVVDAGQHPQQLHHISESLKSMLSIGKPT